jgi:rhodanese-related sulfurtransferase
MTRRTTVDDLLEAARARLDRVRPDQLAGELERGARLVDIRGDSQRAADGLVPGAIVIARNVLEWRCDPDCEARDDRLADLEARLVVMCDAGYQSSLAAATLQDLGFARATDLDGGFQAYCAAGLPVERG